MRVCGRSGRRTCRSSREDRPPGRRRHGGLGFGGHKDQWRRRGFRHGRARQPLCHGIGGGSRGGHADHAGHDGRVLPPLQAARRKAGAEPLHAAAEGHDGARQLRPVLVSRPDASAEAHPGDGVAEWAADRSGERLRRAKGQVGPVVPPCRHPVGAQAHGPDGFEQAADDQPDEIDERAGRGRGRAGAGPCCIAGGGFGQTRVHRAHGGKIGLWSRNVKRFLQYIPINATELQERCRTTVADTIKGRAGTGDTKPFHNQPA